MPELADVPFDPAREPGIADGQVGGLEDRVAVQQLALERLVKQRDQPPPSSGRKVAFRYSFSSTMEWKASGSRWRVY